MRCVPVPIVIWILLSVIRCSTQTTMNLKFSVKDTAHFVGNHQITQIKLHLLSRRSTLALFLAFTYYHSTTRTILACLLSWHTGISTHCIVNLLIHATFIIILKCAIDFYYSLLILSYLAFLQFQLTMNFVLTKTSTCVKGLFRYVMEFCNHFKHNDVCMQCTACKRGTRNQEFKLLKKYTKPLVYSDKLTSPTNSKIFIKKSIVIFCAKQSIDSTASNQRVVCVLFPWSQQNHTLRTSTSALFSSNPSWDRLDAIARCWKARGKNCYIMVCWSERCSSLFASLPSFSCLRKARARKSPQRRKRALQGAWRSKRRRRKRTGKSNRVQHRDLPRREKAREKEDKRNKVSHLEEFCRRCAVMTAELELLVIWLIATPRKLHLFIYICFCTQAMLLKPSAQMYATFFVFSYWNLYVQEIYIEIIVSDIQSCVIKMLCQIVAPKRGKG